MELPFWRTKQLWQMTPAEWESLCDGCGKCCLLKVEYEDTSEVDATSVACKLLDSDTCRCSDYDNRFEHVPDCIDLSQADLWHPLVSGDPQTVHTAGVSIRHKTISEDDLADEADLIRYVVDWQL